MADAQQEVTELARLRRRVVQDLHAKGLWAAQIAEKLGWAADAFTRSGTPARRLVPSWVREPSSSRLRCGGTTNGDARSSLWRR